MAAPKPNECFSHELAIAFFCRKNLQTLMVVARHVLARNVAKLWRALQNHSL